MTIERINPNLSPTEKIRQLNEMIMELNGKIEQAKFDKNELDDIYSRGNATDRKFLRNQGLGHLASTYTNWSHVKAEAGYSIWKIAPTNYAHNSVNNVYLDNAVLTNKGEASAETATTFDLVYLWDTTLGAYTTNTTEAGTEEGTEFSLMNEVGDYLYVGEASRFGGIKLEFQTRGSGYSIDPQYFNGSGWVSLTESGFDLSDGTSDFESDGLISFTQPGDWVQTTVNGQTKFWIRIATLTDPVTVAKAYYVIPADSVVALLALSSDDIIRGNWAWCYYSSNIYVTIRNAGASSGEGDYFITSSSTSTKLENFFAHNHQFKADYEDSTYVP